MSFAAPWWLALALLPAAGLLLSLLAQRQRDAGMALPAILRGFAAGGRVRIGDATPRLPWRFWLGCLLLIAALARPQWGAKPDDSQTRDEVMIALDLSRSMLATDALPSRIERARTIAARFIAQSPTAEIGLIAFAGQAYPLAAPSPDRALLDTFLPAVEPGQMVVPGSNYASMLAVAVHAFTPQATSRTLVLLSDGEAEPTPWRQLLPQLRAKRIHVVAVGLGTATGAHVRIGDHDLADAHGAPVTSRLDADGLRAIAHESDGAYLDAAQSGDLAARVRAIAESATEHRASPAGSAKEDRLGWFLAPALLLLLWSALAEWPALPRLLRGSSRWTKPAAYAAAGILAVLVSSPRGEAVKPSAPQDSEPDPLLPVKTLVGTIISERSPSAADYSALAQAAIRYVELHREHRHILQRGVMSDGLAAVEAGEALEPGRPEWASLRTKLTDMLKQPRSADDPEEGDGEPEAQPAADQSGPPADEAGSNPNAKPPEDKRSVGGSPRGKAQDAEWRVPSLVRPLYTLQKLRGADKPGDLFHLMQLQDPPEPRKSDQTW